MLRKVLLSLAAIVVAVGLAVGASLLTPARKPPAQTVDLVRATKLTCVGAGRVLVLGDADISATPVEIQESLEFTVNPEAAKRMGVEIPQQILDQADRIVS